MIRKAKKESKSVIILIGIVFFANIGAYIINPNIKSSKIENTSFKRANADTEHEPIYIKSNWSDAKAAGICIGFGTYNEPYVIKGFSIDGRSIQTSIKIENTYEYFRIENCILLNSKIACIVLNNVSNGILLQNNCSSNINNGIYVQHSQNITARWNDCSKVGSSGIFIEFSENNSIMENDCSNANNGIDLRDSDYNLLSKNYCSGDGYNGYGISLIRSNNNKMIKNDCNKKDHGIRMSLSSDNSITNNDCSGCNHNGIDLSNSHNNEIESNICNDNYYGINILASRYNNIVGNNCSDNNRVGIRIYYDDINPSHSNTLKGNTCLRNLYGIYIFATYNNKIVENNCMENSYGIYMGSGWHWAWDGTSRYNEIRLNNCTSNYNGLHFTGSNYNIITLNNVLNNSHYGVYLLSCENNTFYFNNLIKNNISVFSDTSLNFWNSSEKTYYFYDDNLFLNYTGNYWDDYLGEDNNDDGIGDKQYNITLLEKDNFPLMIPFENYAKISLTPPPPNYYGLGVKIIPLTEAPYYVNDEIEFNITITNPTDTTGVNIIAYDVWFMLDFPSALEAPSVCGILGDLNPGESKSQILSAKAINTAINLEIIVITHGEDKTLGTAITGSGKTIINVYHQNQEQPDWSFALITDLHIGYYYTDYGNEGFDDNDSGWEYSLTCTLRNAIKCIIESVNHYNIKFVVVLGDIADTAEESEFYKAREILDLLHDLNQDGNNDDGIPYIPLMGNHDTEPYTQKEDRHWNARKPWDKKERADYSGDKIFQEVFWDTNPINLELIHQVFYDSWNKGSCPTPYYDIHELYLQNYAFKYNGINFIALDFADRGIPLPIVNTYPLSLPVSRIPMHPETKTFLENNINNFNGENLIMLSHFPLFKRGGFPQTDYLADYLLDSGYKSSTAFSFGGHTHRNNEMVYKDLGLFPAYTIIETEALSQIPLEEWYVPVKSTHTGKSIRIAQFTDGNIDYSTILKPTEQIDLLWPSPSFTHTYASLPEPNKIINFTANYNEIYGFNYTFLWDFDDGNTGFGHFTSHTYLYEGFYNISLTIIAKNLINGNETSQTIWRILNVRNKHIITNLEPSLGTTTLLTEEDLTQIPKNEWEIVFLSKQISGEVVPIAYLSIYFEQAEDNIDFSTLVADVDLITKRSVIFKQNWQNEIFPNKYLFIPSTGSGKIYICLNARSLPDVNLQNIDLILNVGETENNITVSTTHINGRDYYIVSGIVNAGGGEYIEIIPSTDNIYGYEIVYIIGSMLGICIIFIILRKKNLIFKKG